METIADPRHLAVLTLNRLEEQEDFLGEVLAFYLRPSKLSLRDQALYTELVYGTVRLRKNLDYILGLFSSRPLFSLKPALLNNLRLGAYQILYLDRIPKAAAVNEAVKLGKHFGHQGTANFTNAVLRRVAQEGKNISYPSLEEKPLAHLGLKYSFPRWIVAHWLKWFGVQETQRLCAALNQRPQTSLRVNTLKTTPPEVADHFENQGAQVTRGHYAPEILKIKPGSLAVQDSWLQSGHYYIQDESSALAAHALQVKAGHLVYDLCSAPGGKATHLAQLMGNKGRILAVDADQKRLQLVQENAARLGISILELKPGDATSDLGLEPAPRVLLDAPCTGLGTLGHRPDLRWRKTARDMENLAKIQRKMLAQAAHYVQKGGLLLYSTCTITKRENQEVAEWFLREHPRFSGLSLPAWFPPAHNEPAWSRQFLPHRHDLEGFFVALFQKN